MFALVRGEEEKAAVKQAFVKTNGRWLLLSGQMAAALHHRHAAALRHCLCWSHTETLERDGFLIGTLENVAADVLK